jgi:hypothetical protein
MHDQSASRISGRTRAAVSAMCVRALRITVLKSAGNFTCNECPDLNAETIQHVKCFMFTRGGICCVLVIFERQHGRLGSKISGYGQLAELAVYLGSRHRSEGSACPLGVYEETATSNHIIDDYGGGGIWLDFRIELRVSTPGQQTVANAARSIFSEEAAARGFIARKVWPDANDIEAAGSVRKKSCERRFPHRRGDQAGIVEKRPCPACKAMNHAIMAIMLLSVAIRGSRPVI